ncbi:unnamed protein product, partial [Amoebophrya sp. A25]
NVVGKLVKPAQPPKGGALGGTTAQVVEKTHNLLLADAIDYEEPALRTDSGAQHQYG